MKAAAGENGTESTNGGTDTGSSPTTPLRSESLAYPQPTTSTLVSKLQFCLRQNSRAVLATLAFLVFVLVLSSDTVHDYAGRGGVHLRGGGSSTFSGAIHKGYFTTTNAVENNNVFHFAAVTDMDQLSKMEGDKLKFHSVMVPGTITRNDSNNQYSISFEKTRELITGHNEAGRGAEFSELTLYRNRLLTFDDRTGDVFEVLNSDDGRDSFVVPRFVITEGSGDTDKGMKWEWATVKNNELYLGSMGKEYTRPDGSIANTNNLWISVMSSNGEFRRVDWQTQYNFVRQALGAQAPGYVIHEAVNWAPALKKWIFLPRRISDTKYDENEDERKGSNKLVLVDENFTSATVVDIKMKTIDPLHGFSTFCLIPGTNDRHALAIRSVEEDCVGGDDQICKQRSYFLVFDVITGEVLMDEVKYSQDFKLEGVEIVNMNFAPPKKTTM